MRIGLYPGTFDPVTNGHLDIIGRAVKLVDRLVIGVAQNDDKGPLFSTAERVEALLSSLPAQLRERLLAANAQDVALYDRACQLIERDHRI